MANARNQEKPSPILMLAPVAFVLLGYYYLFFMTLNSDLAERRDQETALVEQTQNIDREQMTARGQLAVARKDLADSRQQTKLAEEAFARAESEKSTLRSSFLNGTGDADVDGSAFPISTGGGSESVASLAGQLVSMFTSSVSTQTHEPKQVPLEKIASRGMCSQMNSICTILDSHRLRRLENSDRATNGSTGLVASERAKLGELLGAELPSMLGFEIQLEGSFPDLIAALRELNERLPAVSILSLSLDPSEVSSRRRVWNLQIGISG